MEVSVNERAFDVPVFVRSGEHYVQEICSLDDALDFLEEWPRNRQGPIYETALRACHRAYCRDVPIGVARGRFHRLCKIRRHSRTGGYASAFPRNLEIRPRRRLALSLCLNGNTRPPSRTAGV
jgi:hypothetical protein